MSRPMPVHPPAVWAAPLLSIAAILVLALAGCAGSGSALQGTSAHTAVPSGFPTLPAPADLARTAAFTEAWLKCEGTQFQAALPVQGLTANGTDATFTASGDRRSTMAYAVYSFGVEAYDRDLNLRFSWAQAPATDTLWIALANYTTNRWQWFQPNATAIFGFTGLADYTGPAAAGYPLYAVVVVTGAQAPVLDSMRLGLQPTPAAPVATMTATPPGGVAPLSVDFDASSSSANAPATLVKYEFDFGQGAGFEDYGQIATATHQYLNPANYQAQVRVTDDFGGTDTFQLVVSVGSAGAYDEVEDNDSVDQAQLLVLPCVDFRCSLGLGAGYPGYDGDYADYYTLSPPLAKDDVLQLVITYDPLTMPTIFGVSLSDQVGYLGSAVPDGPGRLLLQYTVGGPESQPFIIDVVGLVGEYTDYRITGGVNPPTAVLASNPSSGAAPLDVQLDASGSMPGGNPISQYAFDPEGDGTYSPWQPSQFFDFTYTADGIHHPRVRVIDSSGVTDEGTTNVLVGVGYWEIEPNDAPDQAMPLPAFPFQDRLCSSGTGVGYPGYNGGWEDHFSFNGNPGDEVWVTANYDNATGGMAVQFYDKLGNMVATNFEFDGSTQLYYMLGQNGNDQGGPYVVWVGDPTKAHYGDYTLEGMGTP
jgi:PKD repeat protein